MKKIILVIYILCSFKSYSQNDSVFKNHLSINLFHTAINGEAGLYYDRVLSNRFTLSTSYGYRFYDFYAVTEPNFLFPKPNYSPLTSNAFNIGFKRFGFTKRDHPKGNHYLMLNLSYKNTFSDIIHHKKSYATEIYTLKGNFFGVSLAAGFERFSGKHFFFEGNVTIGMFYGMWEKHLTASIKEAYYTDPFNGQTTYGTVTTKEDQYKKEYRLYPILHLRLNPGFGF